MSASLSERPSAPKSLSLYKYSSCATTKHHIVLSKVVAVKQKWETIFVVANPSAQRAPNSKFASRRTLGANYFFDRCAAARRVHRTDPYLSIDKSF